ncbi:hypothetical protein REPUB_Repub15cG0110300 [Reevesia pubescens]
MEEGDIDAEMIFSEGKEVEVTSDEVGFKGIWFSATILKLPKNKTKGKALVEYKNLVDDDNKTPLIESIKLSFIRPLPPQPKTPDDNHCFEVNDVVEAFHLDGWWSGSVSQVFDNPKKYLVSFADPPEEREFSSSDLRPRWEWVNGKWVKSSKFQEVLVSSDCQEMLELSCSTADDAGARIQCESSDAVKSSSKKHELCCVTSRKNKMCLSASKESAKSKHVKRATPEADATSLHPSKKIKHRSLANSLLPESHMKDTDQPKVECVWEENVGLLKKRGRLLELPVEAQQHPASDKMDNLKGAAAIEVSEVQQMTKEAESSITRGLPIDCMSGSVIEESCHANKEEINLQKDYGMSRCQKDGAKTGINRRGPHLVLEAQQPKLLLRITQSPSAGKNDAAGALEEMVSEEDTAKHLVLEAKQPKLLLRITQSPSSGKNDAAGALEEMVSEEHPATEVESSAISGLEQAERTALVSVTDCQKKIIKVAGDSGRIPHENDEQSPLILRYKELQPGLRKIHSVVMEENNSGDNEPEEGQDLPFVKSLPMWKTVESMEIFQVMPQNPHFHPLVKMKEILREGLAIGHMLSFVSLVHRASNLTVADPRSIFTSILDALPDLEILGFDVKAVRVRTTDLLLMKDRHGHLQDHSKEVELQVMEHSGKLTKLNEEIDANSKMLRELEEKQALLLSRKKSEISQIRSLQESADVTTQDIQVVEYDFESLAGSPCYRSVSQTCQKCVGGGISIVIMVLYDPFSC